MSFLSNHPGVRYFFISLHFAILVVTLSLVWATADLHWDFIILIFATVPFFSVLHYLLPAFIMTLRNSDSAYIRGWVELFYITWQSVLAWASAIWFILIDSADICIPDKGSCAMSQATFALFIVQSAVLAIWFGWTLWVTTRAARLMGQGWTRGRVLRQVSLSKVLKAGREGGERAGKGYDEEMPLSASVHPMHQHQ